jgi:hypothetical protein
MTGGATRPLTVANGTNVLWVCVYRGCRGLCFQEQEGQSLPSASVNRLSSKPLVQGSHVRARSGPGILRRAARKEGKKGGEETKVSESGGEWPKG